ncbi:hypothetical protein NLJ89_g3162 [Agrocybe chaxingu]|uniref:Uncharacterized protein n=1 Tax=Agrocybe chaxingu TaxID=84603 RepID=A0A9W8MVR7_9AGAR|nr:hypothetical protein NLJ89_g3162 [Agrocybe chaxingu]
MPAETKTVASPAKSKPTTRSSIRQSLNLASVSKALVDVISKDAREASKNAKKTKDASRRSSVVPPAAPRLSMGDPTARPSSQVSKRTGTPESKTVTRRRVSASYARSSSDEQSSKPTEPSTPPSAVLPRSTTLRPKNLNATNSALPKYRPKSTLVESTKPPSPVRPGVRRRLSTSDEDKKEQNRPGSTPATEEKTSRPISPLPQRAALKANLTNSVNATPPSTPSKAKHTPSVSAKESPSRPTKIVKTAATSIPRPPSSSSSAPSVHLNSTPKRPTPKISTPKASGVKSKLGHPSHSAQDKSGGSPFKVPASYSRDSPSPSERHARKNSKFTTPASSMTSGNMSHISEGTSEQEDSEEEDVELLLAPVAALGAPTPAMPRIQTSRKRLVPQTPTRPGLPTRDKLSYVSPMPPDSDKKSGAF